MHKTKFWIRLFGYGESVVLILKLVDMQDLKWIDLYIKHACTCLLFTIEVYIRYLPVYNKACAKYIKKWRYNFNP